MLLEHTQLIQLLVLVSLLKYTTTSGSNTFKMTPGVIGWNDDGTPSSNIIYAKVTNNESGSADVTVTLTIVRMED